MNRQSIDPIHRRKHEIILSDTTQQVSEQLVIVSKLRRQNDRYLTDIEKGWIDDIITGARTVVEKLEILDDLTIERHEPRRNRLRSVAFLQQTKNTIQSDPIIAQNLTQLMVVAQTLNSATSLLSCCYERHKWSTRHIKAIPLIEEEFNSDLAQLLDRRSRGRDRVSRLVRNASICLKDSQTSDSMSVNSDERYDSMRSPTESVASSVSLDRSEPEGMLSLIIVESIDNWKRNAEMALEVATQQSSPSSVSEEFIGHATRSFGQRNRYDGMDTGLSGLKHSTREEPYVDVFQTISEESPPTSFNQERHHPSYDVHSRLDPSSIRRRPPSRQPSEQLMRPSQQTKSLSSPKSQHDHTSYPDSPPRQLQHHNNPHTRTTTPSLPVQPCTEPTATDQPHDTDSITSSLFSGRSSRILEGTTMSPGTARLVYLPASTPGTSPGLQSEAHDTYNSNTYDNYSSLNCSGSSSSPWGGLDSSPRSNSSDTTVCTNTSRAQRRISRGRAWLERQVEAGVV